MGWLSKRREFKEKFNNLSSNDKLEYYYRFYRRQPSFSITGYTILIMMSFFYLLLSTVAYLIPEMSSLQSSMLSLIYLIVLFIKLAMWLIVFDLIYFLFISIFRLISKYKWLKEKGLK